MVKKQAAGKNTRTKTSILLFKMYETNVNYVPATLYMNISILKLRTNGAPKTHVISSKTKSSNVSRFISRNRKRYTDEGWNNMDKNVLFVVPANGQLQERLSDGVSATTYSQYSVLFLK